MSRKPIMAGNWKMNLLVSEGEALVKDLIAGLDGAGDVEVVVGPPFTALAPVKKAIGQAPIGLAAQNLHWEDFGAYTGEICAKMLKDVGCTYVIVGHSERRQFFHETNETVNRRLKAAMSEGLAPILCVGESLKERKADRTLDVVGSQVREGLAGIQLAGPNDLVLAYEPVWAIGTGETATPEQAQEVHAAIRKLLRELHGDGMAEGIRIQYGGSVKPANAAALMSQPDLDGALVGGASLKADSFLGIVHYGK